VCTAGCQGKAAAYTDTCPPAAQASSAPASVPADNNCEARDDDDDNNNNNNNNYDDNYIKEYDGKNIHDLKTYLAYLGECSERVQKVLEEINNFDDGFYDASNHDKVMEHRANVIAKADAMNEQIKMRAREINGGVDLINCDDDDEVDDIDNFDEDDDIASIDSDDVDQEDHDDDSDDECEETNYYDGWIENDDDDDDEVDDGCSCSNCRNSDQGNLMYDGMDENDYSDDEYEYTSNFKDRVISLEDELDEDDNDDDEEMTRAMLTVGL